MVFKQTFLIHFLNFIHNKMASVEILRFQNLLFQHNITPHFRIIIWLKMTVSCLELCKAPYIDALLEVGRLSALCVVYNVYKSAIKKRSLTFKRPVVKRLHPTFSEKVM